MNGKPSGSGIPASKAGGGQKPYLLERAGQALRKSLTE
jgi:hypothetical protein